MKQTTKRKIAREIVILFSCAVIIGLAWTAFWAINKTHKNKAEQLQIQISNLTHEIDSIQSTFPKLKSFEEIVTGAVPVDYLIVHKFIPTPEEVLGTEQEIERARNIRQLHKLLTTSKFSFSNNTFISDFPYFKKSIENELESDTTQEQLNKIYTFLKDQKYLTVDFFTFTYSLKSLLPLPKKISWVAYQNDIKKREDLKQEFNTTSKKIYSANDLLDIAKWILIIVLTLIYPFRFLFLLLKWAIKTLRQNGS